MFADSFEHFSVRPAGARGLVRLLVFGLIAVPSAASLAQASGAAEGKTPAAAPSLQKPAATQDAGVTTVGDYFKFNANVERFSASAGEPKGEVTAPKGSCFRVSQELEDPTDRTRRIARGTFITGWAPNVFLPPFGCLDEESLRKGPPTGIDPALSYDVPKQMIVEERDRYRYGWTYGALVTPFKFFTKDREFSAGASVGPYLGYRLRDRQGSSSVVALAIGVASAEVKTNNPDGTSSTSNSTGMTVALAYILDIKGTFNVGAVAGTDYYSKSQNIDNSGKLWLGLSFGYKLD